MGITALLFLGVLAMLFKHNRLISRFPADTQTIANEIRGIGFYVRIIAYIAIVICLFISLHYLCVHYARIIPFKGTGADYLGVIVGIMAALVTLLVGWQIFSNIKEREQIDRYVEENRDFTNRATATINQFRVVITSLSEKVEFLEKCCEEKGEEISRLNSLFESVKLWSESHRDATIGDFFRGSASINYVKAYTHTFDALQELIESILKAGLNTDEIPKEFAVWEYIKVLKSDLKKMIESVSGNNIDKANKEIILWSTHWNTLYTQYEDDIISNTPNSKHTDRLISEIKNIQNKRLELYEICKGKAK